MLVLFKLKSYFFAMKLFFLLVLSGLNLFAFGQYKPIYFWGENIVTDSTKATSYGIFGKLTGENLYALKVFDLRNNLITTGTYKDEKLKIAHGAFVYYASVQVFNGMNATNFVLKDKERFLSGKGFFTDGKKTGRWISFYPDGRIMNVTSYVNDIKHGFFGVYTKKGKVVVSGTYIDDEKDGEWLYDNGKVKEIYVKGVKQSAPKKRVNE